MLFLLFLLFFGSLSLALAHDPGLSTATVRLQPGKIEIALAFALRDAAQLAPMDANEDGAISKEEFASGQGKLASLVADEFMIALDGQRAKASDVQCRLDEKDNIEVFLTFAAKPFSSLAIQSKLLSRLALGHRQFLTLQGENGLPIEEHLLSATDESFTAQISPTALPQAPASKSTTFADFLMLGVKHILTGYDHLLFLFALLIVTSRFMSALQIITCFTVAHSITLAVATLSSVQIPSRIVEPLIAASIVYVAIENVVRGDDVKGRWLLTFAFGLIHGFGFASVLRELGVGANGSGIAVPLLSFNLGVELGQIMVAALALPVIWKLRTHPVFVTRWMPACSVVVGVLGAYWFVERVWLS